MLRSPGSTLPSQYGICASIMFNLKHGAHHHHRHQRPPLLLLLLILTLFLSKINQHSLLAQVHDSVQEEGNPSAGLLHTPGAPEMHQLQAMLAPTPHGEGVKTGIPERTARSEGLSRQESGIASDENVRSNDHRDTKVSHSNDLSMDETLVNEEQYQDFANSGDAAEVEAEKTSAGEEQDLDVASLSDAAEGEAEDMLVDKEQALDVVKPSDAHSDSEEEEDKDKEDETSADEEQDLDAVSPSGAAEAETKETLGNKIQDVDTVSPSDAVQLEADEKLTDAEQDHDTVSPSDAAEGEAEGTSVDEEQDLDVVKPSDADSDSEEEEDKDEEDETSVDEEQDLDAVSPSDAAEAETGETLGNKIQDVDTVSPSDAVQLEADEKLTDAEQDHDTVSPSDAAEGEAEETLVDKEQDLDDVSPSDADEAKDKYLSSTVEELSADAENDSEVEDLDNEGSNLAAAVSSSTSAPIVTPDGEEKTPHSELSETNVRTDKPAKQENPIELHHVALIDDGVINPEKSLLQDQSRSNVTDETSAAVPVDEDPASLAADLILHDDNNAEEVSGKTVSNHRELGSKNKAYRASVILIVVGVCVGVGALLLTVASVFLHKSKLNPLQRSNAVIRSGSETFIWSDSVDLNRTPCSGNASLPV